MKEPEGDENTVHFGVELCHSARGVSGWLQCDGQPAQAFASWLELLGLIEATGPSSS